MRLLTWSSGDKDQFFAMNQDPEETKIQFSSEAAAAISVKGIWLRYLRRNAVALASRLVLVVGGFMCIYYNIPPWWLWNLLVMYILFFAFFNGGFLLRHILTVYFHFKRRAGDVVSYQLSESNIAFEDQLIVKIFKWEFMRYFYRFKNVWVFEFWNSEVITLNPSNLSEKCKNLILKKTMTHCEKTYD
jgi:hypothetical protein